jgi:hypothetical protein
MPKVMSFLPRSRASACSMRASVTSPMVTRCPCQPCSAHASAPEIVIVMRNRRESGTAPWNSGASACSALSRVSRRVAVLARQAAAKLRAERIAAAKAARQGQAPGTRRSAPAAGPSGPADTRAPAGDPTLRSPALAKRRASTRAAGARQQAKRDN